MPVVGGGSVFAGRSGSKLRDICRDVGAALLLSALAGFLLIEGELPCSFLDEARDSDMVDFDNVGLENLGVDKRDDMGVDDAAGFFFGTVVLVAFFVAVAWTNKQTAKCEELKKLR